MAKAMVSFFDNFPEYNGRKIEIRGKDGYVSVRDISAAIGKRFNDWTRTQFAKDVLDELSLQTGIPTRYAKVRRDAQTPLVDENPGSHQGIFVHPSVAFAYAMSDPRFFARISLWLSDLNKVGTVNPHILQWTKEEYQRGIQFNRDDISDMYGR
jgi:hypothetical protein